MSVRYQSTPNPEHDLQRFPIDIFHTSTYTQSHGYEHRVSAPPGLRMGFTRKSERIIRVKEIQ
jgi:hypothetical protein